MSPNEHRKLEKLYLGVTGGYRAGFDNIGLLERFCIQCDLDVKPRELEGTNRDKFEQILRGASPAEQAVIIRACLQEFPPDVEGWESRTEKLHDDLIAWPNGLKAAPWEQQRNSSSPARLSQMRSMKPRI